MHNSVDILPTEIKPNPIRTFKLPIAWKYVYIFTTIPDGNLKSLK